MAYKKPLTFEIYQNGQLVSKREFIDESITIGKGAIALFQIEDSSISDLHTVIQRISDDKVRIIDLGAPSGVFLNDEKINSADIKNGDRIKIGATELVVNFPPPISEVATVDEAEEREEYGMITEDAVEMLATGSRATHDLGIDLHKGKILEVAMIWNNTVIDVEHFPKETQVVFIGDEKKAAPDFIAPSEFLPAATFPLIQRIDGDYHITFADNFTGSVEIDDKSYTFEELKKSGYAKKGDTGVYSCYYYPIKEGARVISTVGDISFISQLVWPPKVLPKKYSQTIDFPFLTMLFLLGFLAAMLGIFVNQMPPPPEQDIFEIPDRFVQLLVEPPQIVQKEKPKKMRGNPDAGEGARAKGPEGRVGKKDSKLKYAKGQRARLDQTARDTKIAESSGLLAALDRSSADMEAIFGTTGLSGGITGAIGGLIGVKGTQYGSGGLGSRGTGWGGGGTAEGIGGLGTKGRGTGASGYGRGGGYYGQKGDAEISTDAADTIILGALDKSIIDRVIRQHLAQIRYCYQRELNKNPKLYGKIVVKFVIDPNGDVAKANLHSSTMNNPMVETCILRRFQSFKFPKPKGGGIVIVTYPFFFKAAG